MTLIKNIKKSTKQPNFFIVGASRAGTTSLWNYLQQHPEIFMSGRRIKWEKEPSFFCDLTPPWAVNYRDFDAYINLFAEAENQKAIGEASVNYLISPESATRIAELYPEAKIIIILRQPVERAFSLYKFMCKLGVEWIAPFEKALGVENERYNDNLFKHNNPFYYYGYLYFHSGLYAAQIERYLSPFPREQIHIILFEELKNSPVETTQRVYDFLGVKKDFVPKISVLNRSKSPFSVFAQYSFMKISKKHLHGFPVTKKIIKKTARTALDANLALGRLRPCILKKNTRRKLLMEYRGNIGKTASLIGRNLDAWITD